MNGVEIWACEACGSVTYPARLLCPGCGGRAFRSEVAREGVVAEATWRRRRPLLLKRDGHADWNRIERVHLVSVALDAGPVVAARAYEELSPGERVALGTESGAPVAHRVRRG
jgi:uncharacterized OB-fold protein